MKMQENLITLNNISHTYGSGGTAITALREINLTIRSGELTLLLGPSGSGKTSLLQIMGCLLTPSGGDVELLGKNNHALTRVALTEFRRQHFGFVFQHYNLFPTLRAWENIAIALDLKNTPKREMREIAIQSLARLGLGDRGDSFPSQLSGGQQQRVAIARALAGKPPILLADEPTAALDGKTGHSVAKLLQQLAHEENCAVVVVTHDPRMMNTGDRVITLEDGVMVNDVCPVP
jgi:putative ABC transport system ATP-binding protein